MTKLLLEDFHLGYGSERWVTHGSDRRFVGRFKYARAAGSARHYVNQLIKLVSQEEFLSLEQPEVTELMKSRGYIHYNIIQLAKYFDVTPPELTDLIDARALEAKDWFAKKRAA